MLLDCPVCGEYMRYCPCLTVINSRPVSGGTFVCPECGTEISVAGEDEWKD